MNPKKTQEKKRRRTLLGGKSANTCGFCAYHGKSLTPAQMDGRKCLQKNCSAFIKHGHPIWEQKEKSKARRKARKAERERLYLESIGGSHGVQAQSTSA